MLKFVGIEKLLPAKRNAAERRGDFHEIYREFIAEKAEEQAARCSQCGVPFCQSHCPLQNNIPDWLRLTAEGRLQEAYEASAATNFMPEVCGRICPQDRLCEGNCVIEQSGHGTVTIGAVEKYLTETAWREGWVQPIVAPRARGQSVGIIGAGPAGLAAAEALRRQGYAVTIYDRYDRAGGLMIYGIPNFKLEKEVVARRVERLVAGGVAFKLNTEIGRDISFLELRSRHDAVLIATGVYKARELHVANAQAKGVLAAMEYLTASNKIGLGDEVAGFASGALNAKGKRVVVVGGGDTAMDCVRTAVRQGAKSVTCLYRRDRDNMPGSRTEVRHAEEEGVVFEWLAAPGDIKVERGKVKAMGAERMRLGRPDADGRRAPEKVDQGGFELSADMVIKALGFEPENLPTAFSAADLGVRGDGTIVTDRKDMSTSIEGVFAAGDIVRGASLVVWAIKEGGDAAEGIHAYLKTRAHAARIAAE